MEHKVNKQVVKAGFRYCGHYDFGELVVYFDNCMVRLKPERKQLYKLFDVFDIDSEDSAYLEDITGKYCVVVDDGNKIVALEHSTKNIRYDIKE